MPRTRPLRGRHRLRRAARGRRQAHHGRRPLPGSTASCRPPASSRWRWAPPTALSTPEPSRARSTGATTAARPGRSWPACFELPSRPTWSFPPRPWTSHVRWIAPSPHEADLLLVGIELGGLMRSTDRGETWHDHRPGAQPDVHSLARGIPESPSGPTKPAAAGRPGATTPGRAGTPPTRAGTGTTHGRSRSIRTTPSSGTSPPAQARTRRTAGAIPRHGSTGAATAGGTRSPAGSRTRFPRCPTRSSRSRACSSPASRTGSFGAALTAATPGSGSSSGDPLTELHALVRAG